MKERPQAASEESDRNDAASADPFHDILSAMTRGTLPTRPRLHGFHRHLNRVLARLRVSPGRRRLLWAWEGPELEEPLWPVVWSAADLLTSGRPDPLRACANPDCGWLFIDRSRRRNRRWCDMNECGSRAKARRYYARKRSGRVRPS